MSNLTPVYDCGNTGESNAVNLVVDITAFQSTPDFYVAVFKNGFDETYCSKRFYTSGLTGSVLVIPLYQRLTKTNKEKMVIEAYAQNEAGDINLLEKSAIVNLSFDGSISSDDVLSDDTVNGLYSELVEIESGFNTKVKELDEKATALDEKTALADSAAEKANTAANNADEKADLAETAAGNADDKAALAVTAAENAETAINNIDISARRTDSGVNVTVTKKDGTSNTVSINDGKQGEKGEKGDTGDTGADGLSAYEVAVKNGYTGDEAAWLESLKGLGIQGVIDGTRDNPTDLAAAWTEQKNGIYINTLRRARYFSLDTAGGNKQTFSVYGGGAVILTTPFVIVLDKNRKTIELYSGKYKSEDSLALNSDINSALENIGDLIYTTVQDSDSGSKVQIMNYAGDYYEVDVLSETKIQSMIDASISALNASEVSY